MRHLKTAVILWSVWAAGLLLPLGAARAESLGLDQVLQSSADHSPRILEILSRREAAEGGVLTARGAFDTRIESEGRGRFSGFWDGRYLDTTVTQDVRQYGLTLFGGYRISDKRFPIYEDQYFTNTGGEIKAGFVLSLLRDRAFDRQRAGVIDAARELDAARTEVLLRQISVQHKAIAAYYRWLAAGLQLDIYENLLLLAEERERALQRQVRAGRGAEVLIVENRENVLRRQALVVEARRQLAAMGQGLSLYYRDEAGNPRVPDPEHLPEEFPPVPADLVVDAQRMAEAMDRAYAVRPELALVDANLALAENRFRLARNDLKPQLDFRYEIARDFGAIAEGGPSREETDNILGVVFKIPLQRRDARGRMATAQAEMKALEYERQDLEEQIAVEIRTLRLDLNATRDLVDLAFQEQEQAERMRRLEQTRFENGISDFFLVNTREERAANAQIRRIGAKLRFFISRADYDAAIVNLKALGLAE